MKQKEIVVAVTGGGPFTIRDSIYDYNTSATIRDALPDRIENMGEATIIILKYPQNIPCIYSEVRPMISRLWSGRRSVYQPQRSDEEPLEIDLMLHIGMRPSENCFCFEKVARRDGYDKPGSDGIYLPAGDAEAGGIWVGLPESLTPDLDIDRVAARIAKEYQDIPSRVSDDAGLFFCEFQLYSSLAELYKRGEVGRAEFLHVPADRSKEAIERGVTITVALISALVEGQQDPAVSQSLL